MTQQKERFINISEVIHRTGLKTTSIYSLMNRGLFPHSIKLTVDRVGWLESDIDNWIAEKVKLSKGQNL
ncbi:MAG: AlpA family phage regulatory protein [Pasteurellaceae bacterium]|nr:AlpA family phage regulatory protein [Pasteurellaceae bacterium]